MPVVVGMVPMPVRLSLKLVLASLFSRCQECDGYYSSVLTRVTILCAVVMCSEHSRRESKIDSDLLEIPYEELELDKKIGRGSFGKTGKLLWRKIDLSTQLLRLSICAPVLSIVSQVRCTNAIGEGPRLP